MSETAKIPEDLRNWFLEKIIATIKGTYGPTLLSIPDGSSFYMSYSPSQIRDCDDQGVKGRWTYWKGIQKFGVNVTVAELMELIQERTAFLEQQLAAKTPQDLADDIIKERAEYEAQRKYIAELEQQLQAARARVNRLQGVLRGDTKEETAEKIFAASKGAMNTRSVYILADEIWSSRALLAAPAQQEAGKEKP
jgi:hypothetical protein